MWRSIFYSAIGGYILLLSFLLPRCRTTGKVTSGGGGVALIFQQALTPRWGGTVLLVRDCRPVLLHHGLHDQLHPDAVHVQP